MYLALNGHPNFGLKIYICPLFIVKKNILLLVKISVSSNFCSWPPGKLRKYMIYNRWQIIYVHICIHIYVSPFAADRQANWQNIRPGRCSHPSILAGQSCLPCSRPGIYNISSSISISIYVTVLDLLVHYWNKAFHIS